MREIELTYPEGLLVLPDQPRAAVLVLSGSSGRVERERARLIARHGAAALAMRWFGGPGQPRRIRAVAAFSPSSVVWANVGPGLDGAVTPYRSSWTSDGLPLPFVPYDELGTPTDRQPSAWRGLYEQSLRTFADRVPAATIAVEQIAGQVLITAGGDDVVWPSVLFAEQIRDRRARHGLSTELLIGPAAGHRLLFPGESVPPVSSDMARGGTTHADQALGASAWPMLLRMLNLRPAK